MVPQNGTGTTSASGLDANEWNFPYHQGAICSEQIELASHAGLFFKKEAHMEVELLIRWLVKINFQRGTDWSRHLVSVIRQSSLEKKCLVARASRSAARKDM